MKENTNKQCHEGLPPLPNTFSLGEIEGRIVQLIMEQIVAGNDVSGYTEEAQMVINGLRGEK